MDLVKMTRMNVTFNLRWIPVSESLPSTGVPVLVCMIDHRRRKIGKHGNEYKTSIRIDKLMSYDGIDFFWSKGNSPSVVAWMPIPESPTVIKSN